MIALIVVCLCLYAMTDNANGLIKFLAGIIAVIASYISLGIYVFDNDWDLLLGYAIVFVVVAVFASALLAEPIKKSIGFVFLFLRTK